MRSTLAALFAAVLVAAPAFAADPAGKVLRETWQVSRTESGRLGRVHLLVREVERDGQKLIHSALKEDLSYIRSGDPYHEHQEQESYETPDGRVVEVGYASTLAKNQKLWIRGRVVKDELVLEVMDKEAKPTQFTRRVPWNKDALGLYGQERYFEGKPLKAGDKHTVQAFNLTLNRVVPTTYHVKDQEKTKLNGQEKKLWRVEQKHPKELFLGESTHWLDDQGRTVKTEMDMPLFGTAMIYEMASKDDATEAFKPKVPDIEAPTTIDNPISFRRGAPREVVLRVGMTGEDDPGTLFAADSRQIVLKADKKSVEIRLLNRTERNAKDTAFLAAAWFGPTVQSGLTGPFLPMPATALLIARLTEHSAMDPQYLASNLFIRSDDALVQKLAKQAVGEETNTRKRLDLLRRFFRAKFKPGYDVAFATADEVARTLEGDCSEMGVLSCAMCRSLGIPARVAFGLVYDTNNPGFGGHLWTEVFVDGRWEVYDPTGVIDTLGAAYLKVADYSLKDVINPDELLEIRRAFAGRMKVELVEQK